jgi:biotin carboxyl carrier protein
MPIGTQDTADPGLISNFVYDRARRREDGTFFVPKPLQRLFNVRVEQARTTDMPLVTRIPGRIVPDPSEHGTVQPSVPGRLGPPDTGFPTLGQTVIQGQVLAWVSPSIGVVDRSQVRRDVVRLTTEIRVETETLEILRQFVWVPFREGKLYQSEQRLAGLRRERDALLPVLELREALRSPTDGVISATTAVNGKIVQPGETVFDVIDPTHLWVEATAPDPSAADVARGAPIAAAVTPEGTILTPVMYRIENPPPGLRVGRPLSVTVVNKAQSERGILLNRSAVTQGSSGVEEVWEQVGPESFVPHPVRTHVIDGASVLVLDGVADGARIVVNGTRLMAQLQ